MKKCTYTISALLAVIAVVFFGLGPIPISKAATFTVTLDINSPGSQGTVAGPGVNCPGDCKTTASSGDKVAFTLTPASGHVVIGMQGSDCKYGVPRTKATTCNYTVPDNIDQTFVYPMFGYENYYVTAQPTGTGSGTVTGTGTYHWGQTAVLKATPSSGSRFDGWQDTSPAHICFTVLHGDTYVNLSSTCSIAMPAGGWQDEIAVPKFTKVSTGTATSTPTSSSTKTADKPAAPTLTSTQVDGQALDTKQQAPTVVQSKSLVLSGKTVPNATVTLTIHSTPQTVTTQADKDGNWTYAVTGLPPGDHYVEAKVTDPKTKQTSKTIKLVSFKIIPDQTPASVTTSSSPSTSSKLPLLFGSAVLLAALAGVGWYGWRWYRRRNTPVVPSAPEVSPEAGAKTSRDNDIGKQSE